ncbi:MAG: hypothetical protein V7K20_14830, partial [Nostoc sp.]
MPNVRLRLKTSGRAAIEEHFQPEAGNEVLMLCPYEWSVFHAIKNCYTILKLEPFNLNVEPFNLNVEPFNLNVEPFNLNVEPFNLNVEPF